MRGLKSIFFWLGILALCPILGEGLSFAQAIQRVANQTLKLPSNPPQTGYQTVPAFPGLIFLKPTGLVTPPGETNRLFVLERRGVIAVITNLAQPNRSVFMDLTPRGVSASPDAECGLLGLAFHPGYATNGYFYVFYSLSNHTTPAGTGLHQRLARFQTIPPGANTADLITEMPLFSQYDESPYHNAGDLHFGPDGYLYVGVGDEGTSADSLNNSQKIDKDLFSGILRIDVDRRPGNLEPNAHPALADANRVAYKIPADNPFVGATNYYGKKVDPTSVRTEFYAVGLRNPWRMSFDSVTGDLICGDVGEWVREEVDVIKKGGNYGWAYREGTIPGSRPDVEPPNATSLPPLYEYIHSYNGFTDIQGNSIIGGLVYHGNRLPELDGYYIFGDYSSGHIWAFQYDGVHTNGFRKLTTEPNISSFGLDPRNGDILIADFGDSFIARLEAIETPVGGPLPPTLTETGAFQDLATLKPAAGIVPYTVANPFWSDGAEKHRWFCVPDTNSLFGFQTNLSWLAPTGSVWIKHFDLVTNEVSGAKRRVETRFVLKNGSGVYGITYRWRTAETEADLVSSGGQTESIPIFTAKGTVRNQQWIYPSRSACLFCHTPATGGLLGFHSAQLNCDFSYDSGIRTNQLRALLDAGYLDQTTLPPKDRLPELVTPTNRLASLEFRVRSYLEANCSACHRPGGTAPTSWDARFETATRDAGILNAVLRDPRNDPLNRVIVPGDTNHSMILKRIGVRGTSQMPPLASTELDKNAIALLTEWVQSTDIKLTADYQSWAKLFFQDPSLPIASPQSDADTDGLTNEQEFEAGTDPRSELERLQMTIQNTDSGLTLNFIQPPNRAFRIEFRDSLSTGSDWQSYSIEYPPDTPRYPAQFKKWAVPLSKSGTESRYYRIVVFGL